MTDDKRIAIGGSMKAIGDEGVVEGYAVAFTSPDERDLHGQYFSKSTDFQRDVDEIVGTPILYHHGMDKRIKRRVLGYVTKAAIDDRGVWIQAQLDMHKEYVQDVFEVAKHGALAWSSGANPMEVDVSENGHIDKWGFIEFSETPTPAEPKKTVISAKSYRELIGDATGHEGSKALAGDETHDTNDLKTDIDSSAKARGTAIMDRLKELFAEILALFAGETPMDETEALVVEEAMRAEADALPDDESKALDGAEDTAAKSAALDKIMTRAAKARQEHKSKKQAALASRYAAVKDQMGKNPAKSATDDLGYMNKSAKDGRVTGLQDLRYAHMSAGDMAVGLQLITAKAREINPNVDPRQFVSEDYLRAMTHKAVGQANDPYLKDDKSRAYKSVTPFKANELDASNIVGQGFEWVGEFWGTDVWEKERAPTIYDQLVSMGLRTQVVPQGAQSVNIPTEGSDPIVYSSPEANSYDSTLRPEVTVPITPFGTGSVELTPRELKVATSATQILGEDSIVNIARMVNQQLTDTMMESRDKLLINGDTATAASTNINYIDSTPPTGIRRPYFLAANGFRKLPLVTNTAMSRDGGVLTIGDFAATVNLLPYAIRSRRDQIAILVDPQTEAAALELAVWLTPDLTGGRQFATLVNGRLEGAFGSVILTSGYMPLTGSAGKEYVITTGNNTKGTILAVYLPHWAVGYKRQMQIETARDILSGTDIWVASMRIGIVARGTTAAALSYNITQA